MDLNGGGYRGYIETVDPSEDSEQDQSDDEGSSDHSDSVKEEESDDEPGTVLNRPMIKSEDIEEDKVKPEPAAACESRHWQVKGEEIGKVENTGLGDDWLMVQEPSVVKKEDVED